MRDISRLFRPRSIAVIGGGAWCDSVVRRCREMGFDGPIWPVHPTKDAVGGQPTVPRLEDLPAPPDACFIGVNRQATVAAARILSGMGAGGAVCFASGFSEARQELTDGADLQDALLEAAGEMPILGPNCYGFINYLDGALLWRFVALDAPMQFEIAAAIGTKVETLLDNLLEIDMMAVFT